LYKIRQEAFIKEVKVDAVMLPGASNALKQCKAAGIIVALVSSGTKEYISTLKEKFGLSKYIDLRSALMI